MTNTKQKHGMKSVRIRCFSGPYFPAFGLNITSLRFQFECEKIQIGKTQNTDTIYAVKFCYINSKSINFKIKKCKVMETKKQALHL